MTTAKCNIFGYTSGMKTFSLVYRKPNILTILFSSSVRVPAPCQYAHKLAYLVGMAIKAKVDDSLTDKLFYL